MATRAIVNPISTPTTSQELREPQVRASDSDSRRDSGYVTQSLTPSENSNSQKSSRSSSNTVDRATNQVRLVSSGTGPVQSLAEFDKHVDDDAISRFSRIQSQIEKPLLKYVCKFSGKYRSMAIRLMVLGTSESEAKPYMVVLVPEDQCKRVRKFFEKSSVRALCQPVDETVPSFEVLVYGRPPEPKEGDDDIDVLVPLINGNLGFTSDTYCGAPIIVRQPSGTEKRATFGGIVKAVSENGDFKLYGLTAGHVVADTDDDLSIQSASDTVAVFDDPSIFDSDSDSDTDGSVKEIQEAVEDVERSDEPEKVPALQDDSSTSWSSLELGNFGSISKERPQLTPENGKVRTWISGENFDWALIEMTSYKPNRLRPRSRTKDEGSHAVASTSGDLVMPPPLSEYIGIKKSVIVNSGSEGPKRGRISALPSRLLLHPGRKFVDSLVVNLEDNKRIVDGDSGSWVVNERTLQVYGHVVATDAFGGGYIMPLDETLRDVKNRLSVTSVELASIVDIASVMMLKMADASSARSTASPPLPNPTLGETTSTTKAVGTQYDNRSIGHVTATSFAPPTNAPLIHPAPTAPPKRQQSNKERPQAGGLGSGVRGFADEERKPLIAAPLESKKPPMRWTIPCLPCRRSKAKCGNKGGKPPCESCIKAGKECVFKVPDANPTPLKRTDPPSGIKQERDGGSERKKLCQTSQVIYGPSKAPADAYACDSGYGTPAYKEASVIRFLQPHEPFVMDAPTVPYEGPRDDNEKESRTYRWDEVDRGV
ncbi:hypothetical protein DL764_000217 [Monosporascus ibericus]|uniref:Zn(2)-C6 fungal-type domain-containing protein n=1 Tax=Monosporascus ibericus TaxID=155417 RepID=A0A4Q4TUD9_9PEZI|nr:hypothetical protein DL764_000217 [Monosporascus ibericus]